MAIASGPPGFCVQAIDLERIARNVPASSGPETRVKANWRDRKSAVKTAQRSNVRRMFSMWNKLSKEDTREILLSTREESDAAVRRILAEAEVEEAVEAEEPEAGPFDPVIAALEAEMPELIAGKKKKDVEEEDEIDDEEEEEDELDEEEDEDDFDDEEDEDEFEEEFGDDDLDDDDDDIFYDDDDEE
jgi:hypothetical protein